MVFSEDQWFNACVTATCVPFLKTQAQQDVLNLLKFDIFGILAQPLNCLFKAAHHHT
jgi:hypothetical protein